MVAFLFVFAGSHGGSTLLPPNVTNEFPEYGTMEEGGKGLDAACENHGEISSCVPDWHPNDQLLLGSHGNGKSGDGVAPIPQGLQLPPMEEESSQTVGKPTGTIKVSQGLESEIVKDGKNSALDSEMEVEKEGRVGQAVEEAAKEKFLAGQEKPTEMPLSSDIMAEKKLYWITEEDSTMVLTVEIQPETSQLTGSGTEDVLKTCERYCIPLVEPGAKGNNTANVLGGGWEDFEREFSVFDPDKTDKTPEQRISKETAVSKHVEFQGVEILWIQKAEEQKGMGSSEVDSIERTFSSLSNHHNQSTVSQEIVGLCESSWKGSWEAFRPLTSLVEGGEDEVFVEEKKKNGAQERKIVVDKDR